MRPGYTIGSICQANPTLPPQGSGERAHFIHLEFGKASEMASLGYS